MSPILSPTGRVIRDPDTYRPNLPIFNNNTAIITLSVILGACAATILWVLAYLWHGCVSNPPPM